MLRTFWNDQSGNLMVVTALLLAPLLGAAGLAMDFANALALKTELQMAADAAALNAIAANSIGVQKALAMRGDGEVGIGSEDARNMFKVQVTHTRKFTLDSFEAKVVKKGNQLNSVVSFKATIPNTLSVVLGKDLMKVSGQAAAEYQALKFRDFFLLLDNTPSMGVGATPADVSTMVANTPDRCAFACHIVKDGREDKNSYYNLAKNIGVTTRINVVSKAAASLMDTAKKFRKTSNQYRMAIFTFGKKAEEAKLSEVAHLTSNLDRVKRKAAQVDLMSIPYQNYDNDQQTDFDKALKRIRKKMGKPGNGMSADAPEKILFFVSDGLGDSYKPSSCTKRATGGRCQEPIDTKFCKKLKKRGYKIAVLYTTYLPLPTNSWYNAWIRPFQSEIGSRMEECASPGYFFEVSPTEGISEAMSALFKRVINAPRLTG
jgi:hypothetical protein